jgi:integrase
MRALVDADVRRGAHPNVEDFLHRVAEGETATRVHVRARGVARVTGGRGAASRTVSLLSAIYTWAVGKRLVAENPVCGVRRFADRRRERRLSDGEYAALGAGLGQARVAGVWPPAVACAKFLALTGWRKNEAVELSWDEVDLERRTARLRDSKTGASVRPLSQAACDVLRSMPRIADGPARVFPSTRREARMNFREHWLRIIKLARLPAGVTPHVLRHSFMSLANDLGFTEATIGMICGHKGHGATMTRGYIHAGDAVFGAADRIAATTLDKLAGEPETAERLGVQGRVGLSPVPRSSEAPAEPASG